MTLTSDFWLKFLIKFVFSSQTFAYGAKILGIFPMPAKSQFTTSSAVMKSLIDAGHEVTIITPFGDELARDNYTSIIDSSDGSTAQHINTISYKQYPETRAADLIHISVKYEKDLCYKVINCKQYQELLFSNETSFDAIFVVSQVLYKCYLPIAKKLNAPVIAITPVRSWSIADLATANPRHTADVPAESISFWRFDNFYSRFNNFWANLVVNYLWMVEVIPVLRKFRRDNEQKLRDFDGYLDIEPALVFCNGHHSILPRAQNPNMIEIGGIQVGVTKPLPEKIQKFIDEADHGVILFTFGSFVRTSTLPDDIIKTFLQVFERIPQRVLWKFEDPLDDVPENVMLLEWLPQRDILEHPNVKAFISHCGVSGMYEAIHTATPIISCPLMFDQISNAAILEHLGVAIHLDIDSISTESLSNAINSIFNDTKYYNKMQNVSAAFKDRPLSPQQTVVYWTEYVIKYKDVLNLMPPSGKLNWFQRHLLDIFLLIICIFIVIIYFVKWIIQLLLVNFIRRNKNSYFIFKNKSI